MYLRSKDYNDIVRNIIEMETWLVIAPNMV